MKFFQCGDRRYAQFERLARLPGLTHAFSTRPHDVSARQDGRMAERHARRQTMAGDLGFQAERLHYCVQAHGTGLAVVERPENAGQGWEDFDAIITSVTGTPLMTFSADCPLVLVFDPRRRAVGMAHSSWRCTVAFATRQLVQTMRDRYGCRPADLHAGIGPSAGPQRYEVKDDVYTAAACLPDRDPLFPRSEGRMYFDLWEANRRQLVGAGVPPGQIEIAGVCTMTDTDTFYSFRREGAGCGHFGLMAGLA